MDIKFTYDDIVIDNKGNIVTVQGTELTAQLVRARLRTVKGEYWRDIDMGLPFEIFSSKGIQNINDAITIELSKIADIVLIQTIQANPASDRKITVDLQLTEADTGINLTTSLSFNN